MKQPYIVGWGHTPFGKLDNMDIEQLIRDAALPLSRARVLSLAISMRFLSDTSMQVLYSRTSAVR